MSLNKRVIGLITPLIIISCIVAATMLYFIQKNSLQQLEHERFETKALQLQESFKRYQDYLTLLYSSIRNNPVISKLNNHDGQNLPEGLLGNGIHVSFNASPDLTSDFIAFAIFNSTPEAIYFADNTSDPFSTIKSYQLEEAKKSFESGKASKTLLTTELSLPILIDTYLIDTQTMAQPIPSQIGKSLAIQVMIKPSHYTALFQDIQKSYQAKMLYQSTISDKPNDALFTKTVQLMPELFLTIEVPPLYLKSKLNQIAESILIVTLFAAGTILVILLWLMHKYVIAPIETLDQELYEVFSGKRENINLIDSNDEIARLGNSIHSLFDQIQDNLSEAKQLAEHDQLTELINRRQFIALSKQTLTLTKNYGGTLFLLFIDLDNFKYVNDKYGHANGDILLKTFSMALKHTLKAFSSEFYETQNVHLSRLGGDEFVILIELESQQQVEALAKKILKLFKNGFCIKESTYPVTASIGISCYPEHATSLEQLMMTADNAMYQAKQNGKNRFFYFSKTIASENQRINEIQNQLHLANYDKEFYLNYMPIYDENRKVIACEALLRWNSPLLGEIGPNTFIPIAEASGLYFKIDKWVIKHAIADFAAIQTKYGEQCKLSINLSSAELANQAIVATICSNAQAHSIPENLITFEITETYRTSMKDKSNRLIQELKQYGFSIDIDDFGSGYTSFMQMLTLMADGVKLDKIVTQHLITDSETNTLKTLVELCHAKDISVTAEGIETEAQYEFCKQAGCDAFQGFYFHKPTTIDKLI